MSKRRAFATAVSCLAVALASLISAGAASGSTSPAGSRGGSPAWSVSRNTHGCPSSVRLLVPTKPPAFYASHPQAMLPGNVKVPRAFAPALARAAKMPVRHHLTSISCRPGHQRPQRAPSRFSGASSANWSGYQANSDPRYPGAGGTFLGAIMDWTVPAINVPDLNTSVVSSIWPGIGTGNNNSGADSLIQAGTEQDGLCFGIGCLPNYYFWFEIFPQEAQQVLSSPVPNVGDSVQALVLYDPPSGTAFFELWDFTQFWDGFWTQTVNNPGPTEGTTAEWIAERTTENNTYPELANFGTVSITSAQADFGANLQDPNGDVADVGSINPQSISMTTCFTGQPLANPEAITGGNNFNVDWQNFGVVDPVRCGM